MRYQHNGQFTRLSQFWTPTGGVTKATEDDDSGTYKTLARARFISQSRSGIFHLLPLGLRVQEKIERLVDKHMRAVGASKVSLSSISSQELWQKTGRWKPDGEFLSVQDRRKSGLLLAPTHEEEITSLVAGMVKSYRDLPLRLYQVSRKYRDELRPRSGLLRAKEFLMKDLYTFDVTPEAAMETYETVREAYDAFFQELGVPYLVAKADSGDMGGNLSHEYHLPSPAGEDTVWSCSKCSYIANDEVAEKRSAPKSPKATTECDSSTSKESIHDGDPCPQCSTGTLQSRRCIELGHTFHLGTRYSAPLNAGVTQSTDSKTESYAPLQMGCHGIGISRLIGALATSIPPPQSPKPSIQSAKTEDECSWPVSIAPFTIAVLRAPKIPNEDAERVIQHISHAPPSPGFEDVAHLIDIVLDDRGRDLGWQLKDSDLIGYPIVVVLGNTWMNKNSQRGDMAAEKDKVEVQCRRLGSKAVVTVGNLREHVDGLLRRMQGEK